MSILNCPRCSDSFDSDQHTEPLCKTCMGKVTTEHEWDDDFEVWGAKFVDRLELPVGIGRTEDEAIENLVRAI